MSVCIFRSWLQLLSSLTYNYTESGISTKNRFTDLILHLQIQIPELLDRLENSLFMVVGSLSHLKLTKCYILNAILNLPTENGRVDFFIEIEFAISSIPLNQSL